MLDRLYDVLFAGGGAKTVLRGLCTTLEISALSLILGTVLGIGICMLRMSKSRLLSSIAQVYILIMRGSPVTMLLMLLYYCVFAHARIDAIWVAVITFGFNLAAYVAEMLRSAIEAVSKREIEAALTLGFSRLQTLRYIVFPQAMHIAKPVYQSAVINMVQWTSVVGYISITDLTRVINNISSRTMQPLMLMITGMILYIGIAYLVSGIFALSDRLPSTHHGAGGDC